MGGTAFLRQPRVPIQTGREIDRHRIRNGSGCPRPHRDRRHGQYGRRTRHVHAVCLLLLQGRGRSHPCGFRDGPRVNLAGQGHIMCVDGIGHRCGVQKTRQVGEQDARKKERPCALISSPYDGLIIEQDLIARQRRQWPTPRIWASLPDVERFRTGQR